MHVLLIIIKPNQPEKRYTQSINRFSPLPLSEKIVVILFGTLATSVIIGSTLAADWRDWLGTMIGATLLLVPILFVLYQPEIKKRILERKGITYWLLLLIFTILYLAITQGTTLLSIMDRLREFQRF